LDIFGFTVHLSANPFQPHANTNSNVCPNPPEPQRRETFVNLAPWYHPHQKPTVTHRRPIEPTNDTLRPHNAGTRIMIRWMAQCVAPLHILLQPEKFTYSLRISIFRKTIFPPTGPQPLGAHFPLQEGARC